MKLEDYTQNLQEESAMMRKLAAMLLILCMLLGIALPAASNSARAESFTVYVSSNTLKVYSKNSTSSSVLGTMGYGQSMTCVAYKDGWAAVKNSSGKGGFCKISGLTTTDPNTLNKTAYVSKNNTPVYRLPNTKSNVMMQLKKNSSWNAVAMTPDKDWVRLKNGKSYGYVQASLLSTALTGGDENADLNTPVYITANTLKAYDRASTSGKKLGTMSFGEKMTLLATQDEWARIKNSSGAVGYCKLSGLSAENPCTLEEKVYSAADGVKVYKRPSTSSGVMTKLKKHEAFTCVGITSDGAWARLKNGKSYGYVQVKNLSNLSLPEEETTQESAAYVSDTTLAIYKKPDDSSKKLGTMSFGEKLTLLEVQDGWAKVQNSAGTVGYCLYGGITATNPNTLKAAYYAAKNDVKLYARPSTGASVVKTLKINASVMVVALSGDAAWGRVNLGGSYAYVQLSQLSESKAAVDDGSIHDITPKTVYISATTLVCYKENKTSSAALGTMSFGEKMTCTGSGDGWARIVNSSGAVGYCKESGLTDTNPNTYKVTMYAQSNGVKVYSKASASSKVLATLSQNSKVTAVALSSDKKWVRLKSSSEYGYAKAASLATTEVSSGASSTAAAVIALAKKQIGVPYVYAAQSPSAGFDCSGLTYYVYKKAADITLKRTAYTQGYNNSYPKIEKVSDLKAGDLVFFNTVSDDSDKCDHVGIYIGSNKFIHASSGKGEVTTSEISSGNYYARTFSWGRRVLS